jgi:hypothetical protein
MCECWVYPVAMVPTFQAHSPGRLELSSKYIQLLKRPMPVSLCPLPYACLAMPSSNLSSTIMNLTPKSYHLFPEVNNLAIQTPTLRSRGGGTIFTILLRHQKPKASLHNHPLPRELVIGREPGRMGRLGHLVVDDLLERVDAAAVLVERVHEMHCGLLRELSFRWI